MNIRNDHPRIWLNPDRLANLRGKLSSSPRWQEVKRVCDTYAGATWDVGIMNYALAYQMTSNPVYADKAINLLMQSVAVGLGAITGDQGYQVRNALPAAAVVYDWCYDRLTLDQKAQLRTQMEQWADWVWPETNPNRVGGWGIDDPGNNYYHGFLFTWMIGLALWGDSPKASGYVVNATKRFNQIVTPYLMSTGKGGYLTEGTNYGNATVRFLSWNLDAHYTSTGEDLFSASGFTWMQEAMLSLLHLTVPVRDRRYPGGDQPRDSGAGLSDQDRGLMLTNLSHLDGTTAGYGRWWLDNIVPSSDLLRNDLWEEFLWYRDDIAPLPYTSLPLQYVSSGAGLVSTRSGWGQDEVQVVSACGPVLQSHQDKAAGMFTVFGHGEWVVALARMRSNSGLLGDTINNNMPLISGRGQYSTPTDLARYAPAIAKLPPFLAKTVETSGYSYIVSDCKNAYNFFVWPTAVVPFNYYQRHLLFIRPNLLVVLDWYQPSVNNFDKRFPLNLVAEPTVSGQTFRMAVRNAALFGQVTGSRSLQLQKIPFGEDSTLPPTSWRVDTVVPSGSLQPEYVATLLEIAPSTQLLPLWLNQASVTSASGNIIVQVSGQVITIDPVAMAVSWGGSLPTSGAVPITSGGVDPMKDLQHKYDLLCVYSAGLQDTISTLSGSIISMTTFNQTLQTTNTNLSASVVSLNAQVASLLTDKTTLQGQLSSFNAVINKVKAALGL